uniref:Peroxiredoxin like 2C n=1 Tax=Sphenodon punctatus TaxID=8508 RepID=A0A8D0L413_SPHPU
GWAPAPRTFHFLCYACKEYVEDLAKVPKSFLKVSNKCLTIVKKKLYVNYLQPFCSVTRYPHEIYADPEREIYGTLGMKRGEEVIVPAQSPHVKSNLFLGSIRSIWRAMTGPAFDFQGDLAQQGGTLILGQGNKVHFMHIDKNRLDHAPINTVLQLAGVQTIDFANSHQIIDV